MKVLIVEDDPGVADMVRQGLSAESYAVEVANDGAEGSFLARSYDFDAIILDHSLPKKSGLTICREIRTSGKATPILFLSVDGETETKVTALESGADDYVTKPFSMQELTARVKAITRRSPTVHQNVFRVADLELHAEKRLVTRAGKHIHLTRKEFGLLEYLMKHAGMVVSRTLLLEHIWAADRDALSNTVEAHIRNLRKKLNEDGSPNLIINVQGRGYVLDTPEKLALLS